ncbi:STAS domain-containing protein [Planococcus alpniumensis]|uniref:STAS domain-containing protein n=1 Tax=Planococcus alpniumensis TaxID=2708345 RepID=UPI001B8C2678|nr:STAS domain-containing protein [Planococcus sp. MSAK28401]
MEKEMVLFGKRVEEEKYMIAELIQEERHAAVAKEVLESNRELSEVVLKERARFIELLGKSMQNSCRQEEIMADMARWGTATGNFFLEQGMTLDVALAETALYRKHIATLIKSEGRRLAISPGITYDAAELLHALLDHATYSYTHAYTTSYQRNLATARQEFLELSAPVVPISDSVAILPLVGSIEIDRAHYILERTLLSASELKISTLIIDLSGVIRVDTMVAEQVIKIIQSLGLIGVEAVLTGIRPETAQSLTTLGVDVRTLNIGGSLKRAMEHVYN